VGIFLVGSFYWSMDQVLVQRVFAAKDLNEGRLGAVFCAALKIATPFLLVLPGLIAKALYPTLDPPDKAYPTLLRDLMPSGLLGLTVAGIAAALMGHLSATYNSIATLATRDFYLRFQPHATQDRQIVVGRVAVLAVFLLGALWAPVIGQFRLLFMYLQSVGAYLMMPFVGVFFLGVLWKRITTAGVLACVSTGFIVGPLLMLDGQLHFLPFLQTPLLRPWLHGAILEFLLCALVLVLVSLATVPSPEEQLATTTVAWGGRALDVEPMPHSPLEDYRLWLGLVLALTALLWYWMR